MSGHTPGPWIAVGAWVEHPDDDVADICSCDPATINQGHLGRGYSEICANARLIAAAPAMRAEIERLKRERRHIYDLLARIHRDGGQYTAEYGVEKSCDDAESQVAAWLDTINSVDALIEQARIADLAANSMLIAAAPDLLEVCRRLAEVNVFSVESEVADIIIHACDAIAKATGEKP